MSTKATRSIKVGASLCFALIAASLIIAHNSPATGYELSIYSATPLVWYLLVVAIGGGIGIIVHQALTKSESNLWYLGFVLLLLGNFVICSMPGLRGYFLYHNGDPLMHVWHSRVILMTGHWVEGNNYPAVHLLTASMASVLGVLPESIARYLPAFLTAVYMLFIPLLAWQVSRRKQVAMLAAAATAPLLFSSLNATLYAHSFAMLIVPLLFYLVFKRRNNPLNAGVAALSLMVLVLIPFSHPSPTALLVLTLAIMWLAAVVYSRRYETSEASLQFHPALGQSLANMSLILLIVAFLWLSTFRAFDYTVRGVQGWITGVSPFWPRQVGYAMEQAETLSMFGRIEILLKMYGVNLLFLLLSAIAVAVIIRMFWRRSEGMQNLFILGTGFALLLPLEVIFYMTVGQQTIGRVLSMNLALVVTPIFVGFLIHGLFNRWRLRRSPGIIAIALLLLLASVNSMLNVYRSPYVNQPSPEVTYSDIAATVWLRNHTSKLTMVDEMGYSEVILDLGAAGSKASLNPYELTASAYWDIPPHFGYDTHDTLGEQLYLELLTRRLRGHKYGMMSEEEVSILNREKMYLIINEPFRLANTDPAFSRGLVVTGGPKPWIWGGFDAADFLKLEQDPTVSKLYSTGSFDFFRVKLTRVIVVKTGFANHNGNPEGTTIVDDSLRGLDANSLSNMSVIIWPGASGQVDTKPVVSFDNHTGTVTVAAPFKGGQVMGGIPYKIVKFP